jgi:hypothetical protein
MHVIGRQLLQVLQPCSCGCGQGMHAGELSPRQGRRTAASRTMMVIAATSEMSAPASVASVRSFGIFR